MRIADAQVTKAVLQALHSKDTSVAARLSMAERLSKLPRNDEQYKVAMMAYAAQECGKKFEAFEAGSTKRWLMIKPNNKLNMMFRAARDCAREIEEKTLQDRQENGRPHHDAALLVKQLLDEEVNARMAEWFAGVD